MAVNWQDIITTLGGESVLLFAAAWLIKTALNHKLNQDTETFKARLKADADIEIERFKTSLQMVAVEHQVRFSKLHEKRAEVIAELYKQLVDLHRHGEFFVITSENNPDPSKQEEFRTIQGEMANLSSFFEQNRIYMPISVCTMLDKFLGDVRGNIWAAVIFGRITNPNEQTQQQSQDAFTKAYDVFEEDIPAARRALEDEFRKMLGVEQHTQRESTILTSPNPAQEGEERSE